ncbi:lipopolysaccharide biosynthesis protein [Marinoscillum furvescens]|nr:polysaccharide biosynthesis C-terminal domain-containing protein [Marinoscillum furvescens]
MLRPTLHIVLEGSGEVFQNHFHYVIILLGLMTVYTFLESIYKANLDITSPNFVREVVYKTAHLLIILLYGFDLINFDWYLNCQLIIYTIMVSILIIKNCSRHYFTLGIPFKLNRRKSLQILKYCLFAILNSLGIALFMRIDNLMIAEYIGLQEVGIYTTAIYFTSVILIPIRYIEQISSPLISKAFSNNQIGEVSKYYKSSSINQLLITTFIFSLIVFNLNEIYAIMPNGTVYSSGALVVYIAGCTSIIDAGFGLNGAILQMSKFYRFSTLILFIFGAMNVWLNFQLIPHFGLEGPAIATLVTFLMFNVTRSALLFAKLRLTNFTIKSLWTILLAVLLITSAYFANPSFENPFIGILIKSSILLIIFSIYVFIVKPSEEIQSMIEKALKKIKP